MIFFIGLSALIYEIYSTRVLFLFFLETNKAITIAISSFLAGLAFSSLIFSRLTRDKLDKNVKIIFYMQLAIVVYGFFILKQYGLIPQIIDYFNTHVANKTLSGLLENSVIWIYLFIPAFFIGGSFPLINGLYLEEVDKGTRNTGMVYFWDTFGSILGAFLAGFLLLPYFGFRVTCLIAVSINLVLAIFIAPSKIWRVMLTILIILMVGYEYWHYQGLESYSSPNSKAIIYPELDSIFGDILFQEMSPFGRVTIGNNAAGLKDNKALFINYRDMCHSQKTNNMTYVGKLLAGKVPENSHLLNIGFGCGFTASAMAGEKNVSLLDIAEINPVVIKGVKKHFKDENGDVLNSPKTTLMITDGAELIRTTKDTYQGIVISIEEVTIIYSSPLYTKEYFEIAKKKMAPNGVLGIWGYNAGYNFEKVLYNTLGVVFKNVTVDVVDGSYVFFASDSLDYLPQNTSKDQKGVTEMLRIPNTEINTLDNKALEKYFTSQNYYGFDKNYNEEFFTR